MTQETLPRCPWCGRQKGIKRVSDVFHCSNCHRFFDNDPDEGGTHSDRNPAARIEREERNRPHQRRR